MCDWIYHDHDFIAREALIPVLHLCAEKDSRSVFELEEFLGVVERVVTEFSPPYIAIPERELGFGLKARYRAAKQIVKTLQKCSTSTELHILGCGNPLTFAVLAGSGIAMADGLEWCRTLVGPNYHLFHFQHLDAVPEPADMAYNPVAEVIRALSGEGAYLQLALARNLHAMQDFTAKVRLALQSGSYGQFLTQHFGPLAAEVLEQ